MVIVFVVVCGQPRTHRTYFQDVYLVIEDHFVNISVTLGLSLIRVCPPPHTHTILRFSIVYVTLIDYFFSGHSAQGCLVIWKIIGYLIHIS